MSNIFLAINDLSENLIFLLMRIQVQARNLFHGVHLLAQCRRPLCTELVQKVDEAKVYRG